MTDTAISPDVRAALAKLPANDPAKRRRQAERQPTRVTYRDDRWRSWPTDRGIATDAPHGTLLQADEHGAVYALKF